MRYSKCLMVAILAVCGMASEADMVVSPEVKTVNAVNGVGQAAVTTTSGWMAESLDEWLNIISGESCNGSGVIGYVAQDNLTIYPRTGRLRITSCPRSDGRPQYTPSNVAWEYFSLEGNTRCMSSTSSTLMTKGVITSNYLNTCYVKDRFALTDAALQGGKLVFPNFANYFNGSYQLNNGKSLNKQKGSKIEQISRPSTNSEVFVLKIGSNK